MAHSPGIRNVVVAAELRKLDDAIKNLTEDLPSWLEAHSDDPEAIGMMYRTLGDQGSILVYWQKRVEYEYI